MQARINNVYVDQYTLIHSTLQNICVKLCMVWESGSPFAFAYFVHMANNICF